MSTPTMSSLEQLLRDCKMDWLIDWYEPREKAIPFLQDVLRRAGEESRKRYGRDAFGFREDELEAESQRNQHRVVALLQAIGVTQSPPMLVMAWRIIQGATVQSLDVSFAREQRFQMRVLLQTLEGTSETSDTYVSNQVRDLRLIRHFATMEVNGHPYINGFYALRLEEE
jgi:hypothetical protein